MAIGTLPALLDTGIHADRPAASDVGEGALYSCSTHGLIYQSDGVSTWSTWATLGVAGAYVAGGTDVAVADGGTGASTASGARTNLGLVIGTDVQAAGAYAPGGTDVAVADGGTGASTAAGARTALGLAIGTNVQAWDADLDSLAAVGLTSAGLALLDDANPAAQRTTLGLGTMAVETKTITTQDDLLVGGSSGALARLAKGSDGQVLTVDPSTHHLVWATPSAGGAALTVEEVDGSPTDSAITKIVFPNGTLGIASHVATYTPTGGGGSLVYIADQLLGSDAAAITFTGIPGTYKDLVIVVSGRCTASSEVQKLYMRCGHGSLDTGSNYAYFRIFNGSGSANSSSRSASQADVGMIAGDSSTASSFDACTIELLDYTLLQRRMYLARSHHDSVDFYWNDGGGVWKNTSDTVDQLSFFADSGNLKTGTHITLYGRG